MSGAWFKRRARRRTGTTVKNKFHVAPKIKRTWDGILFASKGEMQRHQDLVLWQKTGSILDLERQVPITLSTGPHGGVLLRWVVDWRYVEDGKVVIEDFTGVMTPLKRTKIRMCAALFPGLTIRISRVEGRGRAKKIVLHDCVAGKIPSNVKGSNRTV